MKRFRHIFSGSRAADILVWALPAVLIVPNVALDITELTDALTKACNVLLPLGVYMLIAGCSRRSGRTAVLCLPLMVFAAFQIVLLYLYGESIIAVDMYLNVVTTNVSEATELLGNMGLAIATVLVLYLPPLIGGAILWRRRALTGPGLPKTLRRIGEWVLAAGIAALAGCWAWSPRFAVKRDIFPVNVLYNLCLAVDRTADSASYPQTSAAFDYRAASTRPDSLPEVYVLVVGETSRADNWQLFGYGRPTNPRLSRRDSLVAFPHALSESNTTHKSVPLALSCTRAETFGDSITAVKSIVSAFRQAGYHTEWLSNQAPNHSYIDYFAEEADRHLYLSADGGRHCDHELLGHLRRALADSSARKTFVVLHTYGSHFNYNDRYPAGASLFTPDSHMQASRENRDQLLNAYDNSIAYTDALLDSVISLAGARRCPAAVLYFSDHGEDIFDDSRERFLHASPTPTYWQLHIPVVLWISPELDRTEPGLYQAALHNRRQQIASSRIVFDTMLHLAGITTPYADPRRAVTAYSYRPATRLYLTDHNEAVALEHSGIREPDRRQFAAHGIAAK